MKQRTSTSRPHLARVPTDQQASTGRFSAVTALRPRARQLGTLLAFALVATIGCRSSRGEQSRNLEIPAADPAAHQQLCDQACLRQSSCEATPKNCPSLCVLEHPPEVVARCLELNTCGSLLACLRMREPSGGKEDFGSVNRQHICHELCLQQAACDVGCTEQSPESCATAHPELSSSNDCVASCTQSATADSASCINTESCLDLRSCMADAASAGNEAETFRRATTLASPTPPGKTPAAASAKSRPAVEAHLYDPLCGEFCQRVVGCTAAQAGLATSETQALLHAVDASWQDCASRCTQDLAIEPRERYQSCIETAACEEFLECAQER